MIMMNVFMIIMVIWIIINAVIIIITVIIWTLHYSKMRDAFIQSDSHSTQPLFWHAIQKNRQLWKNDDQQWYFSLTFKNEQKGPLSHQRSFIQVGQDGGQDPAARWRRHWRIGSTATSSQYISIGRTRLQHSGWGTKCAPMAPCRQTGQKGVAVVEMSRFPEGTCGHVGVSVYPHGLQTQPKHFRNGSLRVTGQWHDGRSCGWQVYAGSDSSSQREMRYRDRRMTCWQVKSNRFIRIAP